MAEWSKYLMRWADLKPRLTGNFGLRLLALFLAFGLWFFVNAGQNQTEVAFQIPIEYRGLPPGLMIVNSRPNFVDVQIVGPRTLLSLLDPGRMTLRLDLRGVTPGQADFKISQEMFRIPRQTTVSRIAPSEIHLDIDQLITRDLSVRPTFSGAPPDGYRVAAVEVEPNRVVVTGPRHDLDKINMIETEPVDLREISGELTREVLLVNPGGLLKVSNDRVMETVKLQELQTMREFKGVEIQVKDTGGYKFRVDPRQINVTVRGPIRELRNLNIAGMVYVDMRGATPGIYELPVRVDLPDGMAAVVRPTPEKVRVRMYAQKTG